MSASAIIGFLVGLYNVLSYFYTFPGVYKLVIATAVTFITIIPTTISLMWAIHELWVHPFSKLKFISFGLAKYFLADAFQDIVDYTARSEYNTDQHTPTSKTDRFRKLFGRLLYSDPLTRSYKRIYYSYAHVVDCTGANIHGGGQGDKLVAANMHIEGAYNHVISIGGHRLCIVDMSKISNKQYFYKQWEVETNYCLHLTSAFNEKHKVLSDAAAQVVESIIAWWSANPEKPILKLFNKGSMTAYCASLYLLYCAIDDDIAKKHRVVDVGGYVHIG